ncbi:DUF5961 family protein [Phenylobacterium sp.]|uniref:DUF5961 family protein n=1 Tax=Phenylobacterium sp. TaxID=1871053 RepID=UPI002731A52E|nr:DUF5961 family protein [Phenylobacterium sp.]MDP1618656.1 DUF5961 family protein [Phenylobacterium sp.]MDP1987200.1 DUF5961 family protein [Phenylobacterium sp.]
MPNPNLEREYCVHLAQADRQAARRLTECSFEAAALAYVEDMHLPDDADGEVSLVVQDMESGHEHCFRVDLDNGETSACG